MNGEPMDNTTPNPADRDLLISRVVDDVATADDWKHLRGLANDDPSLWRELFEAQHAHGEFAQAVQQAILVADGVDAPVGDAGSWGVSYRLRQASRWAGWAVAAGVGLAWLGPAYLGAPGIDTTPPTNAQPIALAGNPPTNSANGTTSKAGDFIVSPTNPTERGLGTGDTLRQVSTSPNAQAVGEMPDRELLEMRRLPDGRMELIYVRRIIEKAIMAENDLYQVVPDDTGTGRAVPLRPRRPSSGPI